VWASARLAVRAVARPYYLAVRMAPKALSAATGAGPGWLSFISGAASHPWMPRFAGPLASVMEDYPKPDVVVEVVRVVVVAVRAAAVPLIVVPGAAVDFRLCLKSFSSPCETAALRPSPISGITNGYPGDTDLIQPPISRPTSSTRRDPCSYWLNLTSSRSRHRRM
jgi:hypothetical protein